MNRLAVMLLLLPGLASAQTLSTRWAVGVTPENAWREYPRPQLVRSAWTNLNGLWNLEIRHENGTREATKILVPFPVESQLSRVHRAVAPTDTLTYRRSFTRPHGARVLLHFGAVDWKTKVRVNGRVVGSHTGGYDPFTFDITSALRAKGAQSLEVEVADPTDQGFQPRGKQVLKPGGIFYTASSGIWQTVWLEGVPATSISALKVIADRTSGRVSVAATLGGLSSTRLHCRIEVIDGNRVVATADRQAGAAVSLSVPNPRAWSPEHPKLYSMRASLLDGRHKVDQVRSYFAFRDVGLTKEPQPRFALNGKPLFLIGPLDQGFWPDGLYTAPSDPAMKYDVEVAKRLGFNMIRKHVKVEPERWYYWCDKLGILVLQDMPSGDRSIGPDDPDIQRSKASADDFMAELKAMIDTHREHPCIAAWVPFNEGWGQWNTAGVAKWIKDYDPTRLVDAVTGWADRGVGDFLDWHVYPGPGSPPNQPNRAIFLGEFGGLGLPIPGHMWQDKGWGYQSFKTQKELTDRFVQLMSDLRFLEGKGLSGAVYTQTTDCETELNGLMTYDRALVKMDEGRARAAIRRLFLPPPTIESVVPTSEEAGQTWRFTTSAPVAGWASAAFDDATWKRGPGGFGAPETPGAIVRTRWNTADIWLRRSFDLAHAESDLALRVSYDDAVEVSIDGREVFRAPGWTTSYRVIPLDLDLARGPHVIAVHCHQDKGGQYVDAGLVRIVERNPDPRRSLQ